MKTICLEWLDCGVKHNYMQISKEANKEFIQQLAHQACDGGEDETSVFEKLLNKNNIKYAEFDVEYIDFNSY